MTKRPEAGTSQEASCKKRKTRAVQCVIDEELAFSRLEPIAQRKRVPFSWDGSSYTKETRGCTPDLDSLVEHVEVLEILAVLAPTGFRASRRRKF